MYTKRSWLFVLLAVLAPVTAHADVNDLTYYVQTERDGRWEREPQAQVAEAKCLDDKQTHAIKLVTSAGREFTVQCMGSGMPRMVANDLLAGAKLGLGAEPAPASRVPGGSAPATQQTLQTATIHVQETRGSAWKLDGSRSYTNRDHLLGRARDRCSTRSTDKVPQRAAVKVVFPSGEEEVIDCVALWESRQGSPADSFDGKRFINGGCANNLALGHLVDCQCAADKLRAMAPEPEVVKAGEKDAVARAAAACPGDRPRMERAIFEQCRGSMTTHYQNPDEVCQCVAADTASQYIAQPEFHLRYVERLRGAAIKRCGAQIGKSKR